MSFDERQSARRRHLDLLNTVFLGIAVLYIGAHALIAWRAYAIDGILAALLTFILLGIGDLYWGLRWFYEGGRPVEAAVATGVGVFYFASMAAKPWINAYLMKFTVGMLEDFGGELDTIRKEWDEQDARQAEAAKGDDTDEPRRAPPESQSTPPGSSDRSA
ncbi:MAG: hypothetical protein NW205_01440 [Hyphomicrobiaceae bacterium]|nr:hypothetical protein [Hyphomicrobiaceae bacterium]